MAIPKDIRMKLAMAKGYAQKNDMPLALEHVAMALREVRHQNALSIPALEREINGLLQELSAQLGTLLDPTDSGQIHILQYHHGKEGPLVTVLREFACIIREQVQKQQENRQHQERLHALLHKGRAFLQEGEWERGCAFLERAADEFYQDSTIILYIAGLLNQHGQHASATKILSESFEHHSKNKEHYLKAIEGAEAMQNFALAEHLYNVTVKQFGRDPQLLACMAHMYAKWGQEGLARLYAQEVLELKENTQLEE